MTEQDVMSAVGALVQRRRRLQSHIRSLCHAADDLLRTGGLRPQRIARIDGILDELLAELRELIALKQSAGYFAEIVAARPELRHSVDQVISDHQRLVDDLDRIHRDLDQQHDAGKVRRLLHGWVVRFREFDGRENTLFQNAWNVDLGTID